MENNSFKDTDPNADLTHNFGTIALRWLAGFFGGLTISAAASPKLTIKTTADTGRYEVIGSNNQVTTQHTADAGVSTILIDAKPADNTSAASLRIGRTTDTVGAVTTEFYKGDNTATKNIIITHDPGSIQMNGDLDVGGVINGAFGTAFPDTDLTPSVIDGNFFKCSAQAAPIEITDFDDGVTGQKITVIAVDGDTDFVTSGNIETAWTPTAGEKRDFLFDGTTWF